MIIKKKITFALEFRCKGKQKNGEKEIKMDNLPLRMRVSFNNMRIEFVTGLRYSDVSNLRKSNVKEDHIEITTIKTTDSLCIELNKYSKAILDK